METDTTISEDNNRLSEAWLRLRNIDEVVANRLCTGCGTCAGVCPNDAVEMRVNNGLLLPVINLNKCTDCEICVKCCPGFSLDMVGLNDQVFGRQPTDEVVGDFVDCYLGHSEDEEVRSVCSSGGVVDQLLIYALEKGVIDGAIVASTSKDRPLEPEPIIARTREEVLSASRSKYCPVATGVVLEKLRRETGRFAFVGLPCHVHGVRKAETVVRGLKGKIVLHVGLFCGHTVSFEGTEIILAKLGVRKGDVARLYYRGNGWPDSMYVELKNGRKLRMKFNRGWKAYWNVFSSFFFTPWRCLTCPDQFNELADVSVGDAWLPELRHRKKTEAVIIARTPEARKLITEAVKNKALSLRPITLDRVKESQAFSSNFKKKQFAGRLSFLRKLGYSVPEVSLSCFCSSAGFLSFVGASLSCVSSRVSSSKRLRSVLVSVPLPLFRLYFGFFKCVFLLSRAD